MPKARSGNIIRRLLRDIAAGRKTDGDTTSREDFRVLDHPHAEKAREDRRVGQSEPLPSAIGVCRLARRGLFYRRGTSILMR
jgi:hypothetical protein